MRTRRIDADDARYPEAMGLLALLRDRLSVRTPPLFVRGRLPSGPGVAVVGTRAATQPALAFTRELVRAIGSAGCAVWSGGALGIDGAAHGAALELGLPTVVVTAGGLDTVYPPKHADLFERVLEQGGALMSLQADGERRLVYQFLQRNYVLAALSIATVLVQAPRKSGARYTTGAARQLGRAVFVVPHAPWCTDGVGCAEELAAGATVIADPAQLAAQLTTLAFRARAGASLLLPPAPHAASARRASAKRPAPAAPKQLRLDAHERAVLAALSAGPLHADDVCRATELPYAAVAPALSSLSLSGVVVEAPAGMYRRADP